MSKLIIAVLFSGMTACAHSIHELEENSFSSSFINNYGLLNNARSTHDYHPFILARARENCAFFERELEQAGLISCGRLLICGYQEDAVPRYATRYDDQVIDDEVSLKGTQGWDFAIGNLFGFMTGYMLQDLGGNQSTCGGQHVARDRVELLQNNVALLQKHAFGQAYDTLVDARRRINTFLSHNDMKGVVALLAHVWQWLYVQAVCDGSGNQIATQNILFSLYYARHILASRVPIKKIFTGPDITYPIEVLSCQKEQATQGAQCFVERFVQELVPIDGKKTAYILCSFTDGVGKTTLLNNVRNWLRYGTAFHAYERIDNSSSQKATTYAIHDKVVLVDLPAQMSHVMIKPTGSVCVDCATVPMLTSAYTQEVLAYAREHKEVIEREFDGMLDQLGKQGDFGFKDTDDSMTLYAKNVLLLDRTSAWLPFYKDDHLFLVHVTDEHALRILIPFELAHSCGLKVTDPECMLFHGGLCYAQAYDTFVRELIGELKESAIERIVFVDCMGMYPRTSRETIRLNFIIQQLCHIFAQRFVYEKSVYQHCTTPYQIYRDLLYHSQQLEDSLVAETLMRWGLYELLVLCGKSGVTHLSLEQTNAALQTVCAELDEQYHEQLHVLVGDKLRSESLEFERSLGCNKYFQAVTCFSCDELVRFSDWLCHVWRNVDDDRFSLVWQGLESPIDATSLVQNEPIKRVRLQSGEWVELLATVHRTCQDATIIQQVVPIVRAHWYAFLARLVCTHEMVPPPLVFKQGPDDYCYIVRRCMKPYDGGSDIQSCWLHHQSVATSSLVRAYDVECCRDWHVSATDINAYAFGYCPGSGDRSIITTVVEALKEHYAQSEQHLMGIATGDLVAMLDTMNLWRLCGACCKENRPVLHNARLYERARLFVRAAATLDMLAPEISADILVRKNNYQDFVAALLLHERITLPNYCHLFFNKPLWTEDQLSDVVKLSFIS